MDTIKHRKARSKETEQARGKQIHNTGSPPNKTQKNHSQSDTVSQQFTMKKSLLELDPDADALIILQRPNLQQVRPYLKDELSAWGERVHDKKKAEPTTTVSPETERVHTITKATALKEITSLQPEQKDGTPNEIVFRVSAKHLSMASSVFRRMVKGKFKESQPNHQGLLEFRTSEWNAKALLILLNIVHGNHSHIPKALSQETVAHIGLIVDYYDCIDIVKVFYHGWEAAFGNDWNSNDWDPSWPDIEHQGLTSFGKKQQFQLFIAWAFQSDTVFSYLATNAILTATGPIDTYLPIPKRVTEKFDQRRIALLEQLFRRLYNLQKSLHEEPDEYDQQSDGRLLGHLMRQMWRMGLPPAKPERPFDGYSVFTVAESIRSIKTPRPLYHEGRMDTRKLEDRLKFNKDRFYHQIARMTLKEFGKE
ncbi:uncharacterized protein B0J16DRAFT_405612 [Fusarium flagelliforme]|uniref:BTB domain-containing protein n=1 Tax=Fusarium flagelliforme TaxID=2675880 RepID=A0A395MUD0_9HYPO|nr:uncharacterized protein B0J16DRAFT_405612 [Fusarium flagelliforme]KAH7173248.1 hypothetical protein B0J16DRAFT_405612 [Fusarium flagelliforme]RFN50799.1 hypothetical protein FIE12Z_5037 [Fusarium flagelliforme]